MNAKLIAPCVLMIVVSFVSFSGAQILEPQDDIHSWNELQLTVPLTKQFDYYNSVAMRFGKNVSRLNDARIGIGFVWKPTKSFSVQPFYVYIQARNAVGRFRIEHRLNLRASYRFPVKQFGLTHRSLVEYRVRGPLKAWRYRPSITVEKDIPKRFIPGSKIFVTEEVFYDSLLKRFSRNRFTVGINKTINKLASVDIYYMRQNDGFSRPGDLHVIGTTWRLRTK